MLKLDDPEICDRVSTHYKYSQILHQRMNILMAKVHEEETDRDAVLAEMDHLMETHKAYRNNFGGLLEHLSGLDNSSSFRTKSEVPAGNSEIEELEKMMQGLMTGRKMSLMQWLDQDESIDTGLNVLQAIAVRLGAKLSRNLVPVMFMMKISKSMIKDKFQDFESTLDSLNQSEYSGNGVVYNLIIALLQKADQELNKWHPTKENSANWYGSYDEIDQLLRPFALVIANMESILTFPMLPEDPVLMRSKLSVLEKELLQMGTELNEMEIKVNEMKEKFTTSFDFAIDDFLKTVLELINIDKLWKDLVHFNSDDQ